MKKNAAFACALAACFTLSQGALASDTSIEKGRFAPELTTITGDGAVTKAASTRTLGARATATNSATVFGGFELVNATRVYVLVRGNSLGTLGVTNNFLDLPRLRLYNSAGQDLVFDNAGRAGFNRCVATTDAAVINFYAARGSPVSSDDACIGADFSAGTFTFTVTPTNIAGGVSSVPSSGEILFEVTLGP